MSFLTLHNFCISYKCINISIRVISHCNEQFCCNLCICFEAKVKHCSHFRENKPMPEKNTIIHEYSFQNCFFFSFRWCAKVQLKAMHTHTHTLNDTTPKTCTSERFLKFGISQILIAPPSPLKRMKCNAKTITGTSTATMIRRLQQFRIKC